MAALSNTRTWRSLHPIKTVTRPQAQSQAASQSAHLTDARKAEVVKMRVFVGMEVQEIAEVLGLSERSVQRDWVFSKAWLSRELQRE